MIKAPWLTSRGVRDRQPVSADEPLGTGADDEHVAQAPAFGSRNRNPGRRPARG